MKFEQFNLTDDLKLSIQRLGFDSPTKIQELSIPHILEGKDVLGESETGSGKTLAFGCGVIQKVTPGQGLQALILTPTRELAEQVKNSISELDRKLRTIAVYGGVSIEPQIDGLRHAEIVIATPGRFKDHLERRTVNTSRIKILVLDEADRMLDMGFIEDVEDIIRVVPRERQTLFFSATITSRIRQLAERYMRQYVSVTGRRQVDPTKLAQVYFDVLDNVKLSLLHHLLTTENSRLSMVFCNTRRTVDFVVKNLKANGIDATAIHGGLAQNKRSRTIDSFHKGKYGVLVATDVAARGLHIDNVSHVYNYEIPPVSNDYIHRIGRTARAGEEGIAINLLSKRDHDNFSRVLSDLRVTITKMEKPYIKSLIQVRADRRPQERRFGRRRWN